MFMLPDLKVCSQLGSPMLERHPAGCSNVWKSLTRRRMTWSIDANCIVDVTFNMGNPNWLTHFEVVLHKYELMTSECMMISREIVFAMDRSLDEVCRCSYCWVRRRNACDTADPIRQKVWRCYCFCIYNWYIPTCLDLQVKWWNTAMLELPIVLHIYSWFNCMHCTVFIRFDTHALIDTHPPQNRNRARNFLCYFCILEHAAK